MIPFEQIDSRLARLVRDRAWLAEVTGRSPKSIGDALAPSAHPSKRSKLLQRALSQAIEDEEERQRLESTAPHGGGRIILTDEELHLADQASRIVGAPSLADYCLDAVIAETTRIMRSAPASPLDAGILPPGESEDV